MTSVPNLQQPSSGSRIASTLLVWLLTVPVLFAQLDEAARMFEVGRHDQALQILRSMPQTADVRFSTGVVLYASGQTAEAIRTLAAIRDQHSEANLLLKEILAYLSPRQRERLAEAIPDDIPIQNTMGFYAPAPKGTIIDVGVMLSIPDRGSPEFQLVQSVYNGILVAVDEFNELSTNLKIRLHFEDARDHPVAAYRHLVQQRGVQAVIGPLRSEEALPVGREAQILRVPVLLPLANAEILKPDHPYLFRFNPTSRDAGVAMARTAYFTLGLRSVGVFTRPDTDGQIEAEAFRDEFRRLGGRVTYHVSNGFLNFQTVSRHLDTLMVRNPIIGDSLAHDAIYVPFTDDGASAILDHFMTGLESRQWRIAVLGNEELGYIDHSTDRMNRLPIIHSSMQDVTPKAERITLFLNRYAARTAMRPTDFAYVGYDVACYLLQTLQWVQNPDYLADTLPKMTLYRGLTSQYLFEGRTVNRRVPIFRLTEDGPIDITWGSMN